MEVDEKPTEDYNDIGGLDKQIEELVEAIVLPVNHADRFKNLGIKPPKGNAKLPIFYLYSKVFLCTAPPVPEKRCWPELVLPKPTPPTSSLPVPSWSRYKGLMACLTLPDVHR